MKSKSWTRGGSQCTAPRWCTRPCTRSSTPPGSQCDTVSRTWSRSVSPGWSRTSPAAQSSTPGGAPWCTAAEVHSDTSKHGHDQIMTIMIILNLTLSYDVVHTGLETSSHLTWHSRLSSSPFFLNRPLIAPMAAPFLNRRPPLARPILRVTTDKTTMDFMAKQG